MAKRLLLNALRSAFADYVVGLTEDKLKLGVWSGEIELHDLQVNEKAVNQLQLPITIAHGTVRSFRVSIPWASLDRNPVRVEIDGVYLLLGPVRKEDWAAEEVRQRRLAIKRGQLDAAERAGRRRGSSSGGGGGGGALGGEDELSAKDKGYMERLVQRIVDNLEITVRNVHVRFEDAELACALSSAGAGGGGGSVGGAPGHKGCAEAVAAVGIVLQEFVVCTTDAMFQRGFIDRTRRDASALVHKLAQVGGLHVYWRYHDDTAITALPPDQRQRAMAQEVPFGDHTVVRPESLRLTVVHNDDPKDEVGPKYGASLDMRGFNARIGAEQDEVGPKYGASLDMRGFNARIGAEQVQQAFLLRDSAAAMRNWAVFYPYRPRVSIREDPKAWWRYAYTCVAKRPEAWRTTLKILLSRKEYVELYCKVLSHADTATPVISASSLQTKALSAEEQARMDDLEDDLPAATLLMFRRMARAHHAKELRAARAVSTDVPDPSAAAKQGAGGWWSGLFGGGGGKRVEKDEDDVVLEDLVTKSVQEEAARLKRKETALPPEYAEYRLVLTADGIMHIAGRGNLPLVDASAAFTAGGALEHSGKITAEFQLSSLEVVDRYTPNALFNKLVRIQDEEGDASLGSPNLEPKPEGYDPKTIVKTFMTIAKHETSLRLKALPLILVYNREVVALLLGLVKGRTEELTAAAGDVYTQLEQARAQAQALLQKTNVLRIEVDVAAPKVIVPLASSRDIGYLHLDCGQLKARGGTELDGHIRPDRKPMWDVSLSDISLSLPSSKRDRGQQDALVEPFGIHVVIDTPVPAAPPRAAPAPAAGGPVTDAERAAAAAQPALALTAHVTPRIRGLMSAQKINQLFALLDYVTEADVTADPSDEGPAHEDDAKLALHAGLSALPEGAPVKDLTAARGGALTRDDYAPAPGVRKGGGQGGGEGEGESEETRARVFLRQLLASVKVEAVELALVEDPPPARMLSSSSTSTSAQRGSSGGGGGGGGGSGGSGGGSDGAARELLHLTLGGLALDVERRASDLCLVMSLSSLSIDDMLRPEESGLRRMAYSSAAAAGAAPPANAPAAGENVVAAAAGAAPAPDPQQQVTAVSLMRNRRNRNDKGGKQQRPRHLILIHYAQADGPDSPLRREGGPLRGHDSLARLRFSTLSLSLNSACLDTIAPFYRAVVRMPAPTQGAATAALGGDSVGHRQSQMLAAARRRSRSGSGSASVLSLPNAAWAAAQQRSAIDAAARAQSAKATDAAKSILVEIAVSEVSLELVAMRAGAGPVRMRAQLAKATNAAKSILVEIAVSEVSLELVAMRAGAGPVVRAAVSGFQMEASQRPKTQQMGVKMSLASVTMTDIRKAAAGNAHTTILAPKRSSAGGVAPRAPPLLSLEYAATASGAAVDLTLDLYLSASTPCIVEHCVCVQPAALALSTQAGGAGSVRAPPLLSLEYAATASGAAVDLTVRNFICNLMADPIREVAGAVARTPPLPRRRRCHRRATLSSHDRGGWRGRENAAAAAPPPPPPPRDFELVVRATIEEARLQLVQNATNPRSKLVVLRTSLRGDFSRKETGLSQQRSGTGPAPSPLREDSVLVELLSIESFVDHDASRTHASGGRQVSQILEPFSAVTKITAVGAAGGSSIAAVTATARLDEFEARVSYMDVMLIVGFVQAAVPAAAAMASSAGGGDAGSGDDDEISDNEDAPEPVAKGEGEEGEEEDEEDWLDMEATLPAVSEDANEDADAGTEPKTLTSLQVEVDWSLARIILVNDYQGQGVPVINGTMSDMNIHGSGFVNDFEAFAKVDLEARFFNARVARWEPLVEHWPLHSAMSMKEGGRYKLALQADELLIINATENFLMTMLTTYRTLFSEETGQAWDAADGRAADCKCRGEMTMLTTYRTLFSEETGQAWDAAARDSDPLLQAAKEGTSPGWEWGGDSDDEGDTDVEGGDRGKAPQRGDDSEGGGLITPSPTLLQGLSRRAHSLSGGRSGASGGGGGGGAPILDTSVHVLNDTGLELVVCTSDLPQAEMTVPNGARAALPFLQPSNSFLSGERDLRGKLVRIAWAPSSPSPSPSSPSSPGTAPQSAATTSPRSVAAGGLAEAREPLRRLPVDRACTSVYPLVPTDATAAVMGAAGGAVVEEAWENQRYDNVRRVWRGTTGGRDRPEWSTKANPHDQTDEEGWEYAIDFAHFGMVHRSRTNKDLDQARRRRWIRTRAPRPLPLNDPHRPLELVWEVGVTPQGGLLATARSTVQISNATRLPLEVAALCSAWGTASCFLGVLQPGATLSVPVLLAYATHYQLRPASCPPREGQEDSECTLQYTWCAPFPVVLNHVDKERHAWATCVRGGDDEGQMPVESKADHTHSAEAVHLVVHVETAVGDKVAKVMVLPPLVISSELPCSLVYRAWHQPAEGAGLSESGRRRPVPLERLVSTTRVVGADTGEAAPPHSGTATGRVAPAENAQLVRLCIGNGGGGAWVQVGLPAYGWSKVTQLLPASPRDLLLKNWRNRKFTLPLPDGRGQTLELQCTFEPLLSGHHRRRCPALRLHIATPLWLVDRTGLDLKFKIRNRGRTVPVPRPAPLAAPEPAPASCPDAPQVGGLKSRGSVMYEMGVTEVGAKVYVDRDYRFAEGSLPKDLLGCAFVRTANSDKLRTPTGRSSHSGAPPPLIKFTITTAPATVYLLFDDRASEPPAWVPRSGFRLARGEARLATRGAVGRQRLRIYSVYAKDVGMGEVVRLGANRAEGVASMYLVVVGPRARRRVSMTYDAGARCEISSMSDELESAWTDGTQGLFICHGGDGEVSLWGGLRMGGGGDSCSWSDLISTAGGQEGVFAVKAGNGLYELALQSENMPGRFRHCTKVCSWQRLADPLAALCCVANAAVDAAGSMFTLHPNWVTIVPRFCVVNLLRDGPLLVRQAGAHTASPLCVQAGAHSPWHWPEGRGEKVVELRAMGSDWSLDALDISRVGSTALLLPGSAHAPEGASLGRSGRGGGGSGTHVNAGGARVVHVDVKLARNPRSDEYAVLVVVWAASRRNPPMFRVRNRCAAAVRVHQAARSDKLSQIRRRTSVTVMPGESSEIGWPYPTLPSTLGLSIAESIEAVARDRFAELPVEGVGNWVQVDGGGGGAGVFALVVVEGGTKVILLTDMRPGRGKSGSSTEGDLYEEASPALQAEAQNPALQLEIRMKGVGLSVVGTQYPPVDAVDQPLRRAELVYAQATDIFVRAASNHKMRFLTVVCGSIQMDNHMDKAPFPVAFASRDATQLTEAAQDPERRPSMVHSCDAMQLTEAAQDSEQRPSMMQRRRTSRSEAGYASTCRYTPNTYTPLGLPYPSPPQQRRRTSRSDAERKPFFHFSAIAMKDGAGSNTMHFENVQLRVLDAELAEDRASVTALFALAAPLLSAMSPQSQRCAMEDSRQSQRCAMEDSRQVRHFFSLCERRSAAAAAKGASWVLGRRQPARYSVIWQYSVIWRHSARALTALRTCALPARWHFFSLCERRNAAAAAGGAWVLGRRQPAAARLLAAPRARSGHRTGNAQARCAWLEGHTATLLARAGVAAGGYCNVELARRYTRARREYFKIITFHPLMLTLSWVQDPAPKALAEAAQLQLIGAIPTVHRSRLAMTSYLVENAFGVRDELLNNIMHHYITQAVTQVLKLVGSIRALGSPADFVSGVGSGAKALLYAPISASILEPGEFFRYVCRCFWLVHGVFNSMAGVAGGMTNVAAKLALDKDYRRKREARQVGWMASGGGVVDGLARGGENIAGGVYEGVSGIFTTPIRGAKNAGVGGFLKGVGHGVLGAVVKPVVGLSDGVVSVLQGVSNSSDNVVAKKPLRPRRALELMPGTSTMQAVLVPYSQAAAEAQELAYALDDLYMGHALLPNGMLLVFGEKKIIMVQQREDGKKKTFSPTWQAISHAEVTQQGIVLLTYEGPRIGLSIPDLEQRVTVYRQLLAHADAMGNPTRMPSVCDVFGAAAASGTSSTDVSAAAFWARNEESPSATGEDSEALRRGSNSAMQNLTSAVTASLDAYTFGRANRNAVPFERLTEAGLIARAEQKLRLVGVGNWERLDSLSWELVQLWDQNHTGFSRSRCLAVVFINASPAAVQFNEVFKQDALGWRLLAGPQCDLAARQMSPGGVCILLAWGYTPSLLKRGTVEIRIETTAFSALFTLDRKLLYMRSKGAYSCGFAEETITEWYSKQVVIIKGTQYDGADSAALNSAGPSALYAASGVAH
ncbi:hypothetical protein JKP88DRAFT_265414 [Tribonema minus]|uniref:Peroxin/Ferlin domain-containing protein n=1 Tax=Tribonema minus TaxID=303371 RepID=A0A836C8S3_9STRA|nr:hypothetical protein JKP88DRAFT_265414 [Tribonema minus]